VAPQIFAGHYLCPICEDGLMFVPETELTPIDPDGLNLCSYEILRCHEDSSQNT